MTETPDKAREIAPLVMFGFGAERFIQGNPYQNGRMTDFRPAVLPANAPDPTPVAVEVASPTDEDPKVSSVTVPASVSQNGSTASTPEVPEITHPSRPASPEDSADAVKGKKPDSPFLKLNGEN